MHFSFEALGSFDQINLGSTFLQAVVTLSFAGVQLGVARHFDRPANRETEGPAVEEGADAGQAGGGGLTGVELF